MTKLVGYNLAAPFKGMATQVDPVLAAQQGFLADAVNVTYDEVAAKPMPLAMQEVAQADYPPEFIFFHYGKGWIVRPSLAYGVRGARSAAGYTVSYITDSASFTGKPLKYYGSAALPVEMGLNPPVSAPTFAAGARNNIRAAYTYVNYGIAGDDEIESNPSPATAAFKDGGSVTVTWPSNSRVTAAYIYATYDNDPDGTLYRAGYVLRSGAAAGSTSVFSLAAYSRDAGIDLDWGLGGFEGNESGNTFDHAPPGRVTCFSDKFHGTEGGSEDNKGGTLFYALDNVVGWTETGEPEYFPEVNKYVLQGTVRALVSVGTQTYAFLDDQVWAFSGQHSTAITARQVSSNRGVVRGKEQSVQATPYGIVYCSREGLCVFDGNDSRIICQEVLREFNPQPATNSTEHRVASAYIDGIYYLCVSPYNAPQVYIANSFQTWRVDLRESTPIATRCTLRFFSSHRMGYEEKGPTGADIYTATTWAPANTYASGDAPFFVQQGNGGKQAGARYLSLLGANTNNHPILKANYWCQVPDGLTYLALVAYEAADLSARSSGGIPPVWSATQSYGQYDIVYHGGAIWQSSSAANTGNNPSSSPAFWFAYFPSSPQKISVCPYSEDPLVNRHDPLPMTLQTHPLRLGPIHSVSKLRRARVDGIGSATVTFSFNADAARTYTRAITATNNAADRFMLPMSLYGDNFTIKVESTTTFTLRQVELEGSTNR